MSNSFDNKKVALEPRFTPGQLMLDAFSLAIRWHGTQPRKGTDVPYISHLMIVGALIIEYGGTQEQCTAGILHDILEDTKCTKFILIDTVGREVTDIVEACTQAIAHKDTDTEEDFEIRKQHYLASSLKFLTTSKISTTVLTIAEVHASTT
jgi:(p)ppGpp synthase/HD superfamily hydrolase